MWGRLYDCVNGPLERAILAPRRAHLLCELAGVILDVGAGTGANLPHFRSATRVIATEPSAGMRKRLATRLKFARLRQSAVVEDVNLKVARGLDKALFAKLVAVRGGLIRDGGYLKWTAIFGRDASHGRAEQCEEFQAARRGCQQWAG